MQYHSRRSKKIPRGVAKEKVFKEKDGLNLQILSTGKPRKEDGTPGVTEPFFPYIFSFYLRTAVSKPWKELPVASAV